jgi:peptide/nickel transport system ATP-binding protein
LFLEKHPSGKDGRMSVSLPEANPSSPVAPGALLRVDRLAVRFGGAERPLGAVDGASFHVARGETVCLVGESGSGKTVTALSILRLEEHRHARIVAGDIVFDGRGLVGLGEARLDELRGCRIAMIFQEPMTAFDPVFTIGEQIVETIVRHERVGRKVAWERAVRLLERVAMPDARLRMKQIPQELSGGMRQRAMIAMALACGPELLIADEPTTALDVTIQAQILALLKRLQREDRMAILLITHDLGVAAEMADRVVVMYAGRVAEQAPVHPLFSQPRHPYTRGLLACAVPDGASAALAAARSKPDTESAALAAARSKPDTESAALAAARSKPRVRLATIAGSIPRLDDMPSGCRFHPRCTLASPQCREHAPPPVVSGDREVACWHPLEPELGLRDSWRLVPAIAGDVHVASGERRDAGEHAPSVLVEASHIRKHFDSRRGWLGTGQRVSAVDDVSLEIARGETLGLVGESGCGKSTLGRVLLQLERASSGEVRFEGRLLAALRGAERKRVRREMQMIFQDPHGSIDPRWTVGDVIAEPLVAHDRPSRETLRTRVEELLDLVGLDPSSRTSFAHEFSGGQRQRIGIARAIALRPKFIVADEAVSALDLSVQAQVINLLGDLRERLGLTCMFIGHGLDVVRHLSDRIGVMYLGRLVEVAPAEELFRHPAHHYTRALISSIAVPDPNRRRELVPPTGELPSPTAPPPGCHFHPRCPAATDRCKTEAPPLRELGAGRLVACHHPRA